MSLKSQIQELVSAARTEDALKLLAQHSQDAVLLQARFANGKRQYLNGLLDGGEWFRIQNQVNFAVLEMAEQVDQVGGNSGNKSSTASDPKPIEQPAPKHETSKKPKVFISYNHKDQPIAIQIHDFLEKNDCEVIIDFKKMVVGDKIEQFILEQIKNNNSIVSIVSKNSLQSGWVGMESDFGLYARLLTEKKFIPVSIDNSIFDDDFFFETITNTDTNIENLDKKIERSRQLKIGYDQFQAQRERALNLRNNLPKIIDHFQSVLFQDLSQNFDSGMLNVLAAVKV